MRTSTSYQAATDAYARAFEAGALAALDYIAEQWPHMAEASDDFPGITMATAEHIGRVVEHLKCAPPGFGA